MNELRLLLLLMGFIILAGLYVRERLRSRDNPPRDDTGTDADAVVDENLKIPAYSGEEDYTSMLSALKKDRFSSGGEDSIEAVKQEPRDTVTDRSGDSDQARILILHVVAEAGQLYHGRDLLAAFDGLGLVYGDMQIYHHYGISDMKTDRPLFHLANMLEPGYFDPDNMNDFSTSGLSLFMQLPPPLEPEAVFELMLNCARRLADTLGGQVLNQDRQPLNNVHIELLRARVRASA